MRSMSTSGRSKLLSKDRNTRQKSSKPSRRDSCESVWSPSSTKNDARRIPGHQFHHTHQFTMHDAYLFLFFTMLFSHFPYFFRSFSFYWALSSSTIICIFFHFPYFKRIFIIILSFFFISKILYSQFFQLFWAVALYSFTLIVNFLFDPLVYFRAHVDVRCQNKISKLTHSSLLVCCFRIKTIRNESWVFDPTTNLLKLILVSERLFLHQKSPCNAIPSLFPLN